MIYIKNYKFCIDLSIYNYEDMCIIVVSLITHAPHFSVFCKFDNYGSFCNGEMIVYDR